MSLKHVSIRDVAQEAGVSVTTVSHTISGKRPVSKATEKRVRQAMADLGYEPSYAARALSIGSTQAIGVLVPDITNHFFAELASGVEDAAHSYGYSVVLGNTGFDPEREVDYLKMIQRRAIDGLVYAAGSPVAGSIIEELAKAFPIALADEQIDGTGAILVASDNVGGGRLVAQHLQKLGHEAALVITGPAGLRSSDDRVTGFRQEFTGIVTVVEGDFQTSSGFKTVLDHPPDEDRYTAIFALNDLMALGAISGLRSLDLEVPSDISVCGFDDIPTAELMHPTLTTVHQPAYTIGQLAAERLLKELTGQADEIPKPSLLPVTLAERSSTAPPPSMAPKEDENK